MLEIPDSGLMFPILGYAGKTSKARGAPERVLFTLTWAQQEKELNQDHRDGVSAFSIVDPKRLTGLPMPYDELVWTTKFAISNDYLVEIKRMSLVANNEWAIERPFDTVVRERCLNPAIEHIWCAFYLIADCVWDDDGHYFDRSWLSYAMPYMLAYKFWRGQTGSGLVMDHSKMDKLKEEHARSRCGNPQEQAAFNDFVQAIDAHEAIIHNRPQPTVWENSNE